MRFVGMIALILATTPELWSQDPSISRNRDEERELGWSNVADLAFVVTSGNSSTSTLSVDDRLVRVWENAELSFRGGALRTKTPDDRFAIGTPEDFRIVEDAMSELDNERYYLSGRYDRDITARLFWVVGAGWDRDKNAGIENRSLVFGGVGHTWRQSEHVAFKTDYTLTYTRRSDFIEDPERDKNFSEVRLSWDYMHKLRSETQFDSDFEFFVNTSDASDYRFNTPNTLTTNLSSILALRFGAQFLYQNFPALEEIALFDVDPAAGGASIGTAVVRKKKLDTVLRFSLVVTF